MGIWAGRFCARQQESRARQYEFTVPAEPKATVRVPSAQAVGAQLALFLRTPKGWEQTASYEAVRGPEGLALTVDAEGAAQDGGANLLGLAALDPRTRTSCFSTAPAFPASRSFSTWAAAGRSPGGWGSCARRRRKTAFPALRPGIW